jgi:nitrile hydratase accessory protein
VNDTPSPPVFDEPWEAKVFAMAVRLHERGLFTWPEWTDALGAEIATGNTATGSAVTGSAVTGSSPGAGSSYYGHWLRALEALLDRKGVASPDELARYCAAWGRAAARTPHGLPVELADGDLR